MQKRVNTKLHLTVDAHGYYYNDALAKTEEIRKTYYCNSKQTPIQKIAET